MKSCYKCKLFEDCMLRRKVDDVMAEAEEGGMINNYEYDVSEFLAGMCKHYKRK